MLYISTANILIHLVSFGSLQCKTLPFPLVLFLSHSQPNGQQEILTWPGKHWVVPSHLQDEVLCGHTVPMSWPLPVFQSCSLSPPFSDLSSGNCRSALHWSLGCRVRPSGLLLPTPSTLYMLFPLRALPFLFCITPPVNKTQLRLHLLQRLHAVYKK